MKSKKIKANVGVLVGRFQVDELHEAHQKLIEGVIAEHEKVIIFLGLAPTRVTRNNPLDFEARKQMILQKYPNVIVLYIKDIGNNEKWSKKLDEQIGDIANPNETVMLYGGRESFIDHYLGKYPTYELQQESYVSGSEIRKKVSDRIKASPDFRAGVIWAAHNQYPKVHPNVDIAVWDKDKKRLLMARKENQDLYRFIGGFATPKESYEESAKREVEEEAHIQISDPVYVCSCPIDDWRYRREVDGIITILFEAEHKFGKPNPDDDICELRWFDADKISRDDVVEEHRSLLNRLRNKNYKEMGMVDPSSVKKAEDTRGE